MVPFRKFRSNTKFGALKINVTRGRNFIQTLKHWNLIGHSMTAHRLRYRPAEFFRSLRLKAGSIQPGKIRSTIKIVTLSFWHFFLNCVSLKLSTLKRSAVWTRLHRATIRSCTAARTQPHLTSPRPSHVQTIQARLQRRHTFHCSHPTLLTHRSTELLHVSRSGRNMCRFQKNNICLDLQSSGTLRRVD
jgi:hypothetical protein